MASIIPGQPAHDRRHSSMLSGIASTYILSLMVLVPALFNCSGTGLRHRIQLGHEKICVLLQENP